MVRDGRRRGVLFYVGWSEKASKIRQRSLGKEYSRQRKQVQKP